MRFDWDMADFAGRAAIAMHQHAVFDDARGQSGAEVQERNGTGHAVRTAQYGGRPPMPDLIRRAKKREAKAVDVLDMVVRAIGDTIQILAQSVDPRLIVLGGGMAKTGEPLVEVITAELRRRESQCRFLETLDLPARLRLAPVDQPVGAIGAAMAA